MRARTVFLCAALAAGLLLAGCGGGHAAAGTPDDPVTLRLGYFPNITHAPALVGVEKGIFAERLGPGVRLKTTTFNAGPAAVEALFSGALDAAYIGPNPTVNAFTKSKGAAIKVVSGAASGGAALVVKASISTPEDLRGKKIATPQLGNTQDVALRYWLKSKGMPATKEGDGPVKILPQENAHTVDAFASGAVDGAWVPEPFVSRLVNAGGKVLVDERDLWPGGRFVVTNLVVSTTFQQKYPDVVRRLVAGQVAADAFIHDRPDEAQQAISVHVGRLTGKPLDLALIRQAWRTIEFLDDPVTSSLKAGLDHAVAVGLTDPASLDGIYDLSYLDEALRAAGKPGVGSA